MFKALRLTVVATIAATFVSSWVFAEDRTGEILGKLFDQLIVPQIQKQGTPAQPADKRVPLGRGEMQLSFAPLVKLTSPSVVNVYAARKVRGQSMFGGDPFFDQFFGQDFSGPPRMQQSLGSGVIVDPSGLIVTNNHVIADADEVKVALADGREYDSTVILKDARVDLAILKIKPTAPLLAMQFADSDQIEVGDLVLAMGNPFGVGQTTTSGIISALARNQVGVSDFGSFIQTDAAINPGNSGGALISMSGKLIGINTAIFSKSGGSVGIGFAIPSNMVRTFVDTAKGGGTHFDRPYIGATFEPVTSDIADSLGIDRPTGVLVNAVVRGGPAEKAGLKVGDVITAMDNAPIQSPDDLGYRLSTKGLGKIAQFEVLSKGATRLIRIAMVKAPQGNPADDQLITEQSPLRGATLANLSPDLADELQLPTNRTGVVIKSIQDGSTAQQIGMEVGDIILELNRVPASNAAQTAAIARKPSSVWRFKIDRGGQIITQLFR